MFLPLKELEQKENDEMRYYEDHYSSEDYYEDLYSQYYFTSKINFLN